MKYNKKKFYDMTSEEKLNLIKQELGLETHNATTKEDFIMMIDWLYKELEDKIIVESLFTKLAKLRNIQFSYNVEISILENYIYVNQCKLHTAEHNLSEVKKDIEYAMKQGDKLVCPICGTIYANGLDEQLNITSDYAHCEKLIEELKNIISVSTEKMKKLEEEKKAVSLDIQSIEQQIQNS